MVYYSADENDSFTRNKFLELWKLAKSLGRAVVEGSETDVFYGRMYEIACPSL